MSNPLVAQQKENPTGPGPLTAGTGDAGWGTGIGIAESINDVASLNDGSSWVESGLAYGGLVMEAVSIATDPIGTLLSYGLSWLIEHVEPLKEALDWFAGDPDGVKAYGETWANVSKAVGEAATQYNDAVKADTGQWTGAAGDAYRQHAVEKGEALAGASELANTISTVVTVMGEVVSFVREFVRDLVADCISRLITYALEALAPPGVSLAWVVPQAVSFIARTVSKITEIVTKLIKTISNVAPKLAKLVEVFGDIMKALGKMGKRAAEGVGKVADKLDVAGKLGDKLAEKTWKKVDDVFGTDVVGKHNAKFGGPDAPGGGSDAPGGGSDSHGGSGSDGGSGSGAGSGSGSSGNGSGTGSSGTGSGTSGDGAGSGSGTSGDGASSSGSGSTSGSAGGGSTGSGSTSTSGNGGSGSGDSGPGGSGSHGSGSDGSGSLSSSDSPRASAESSSHAPESSSASDPRSADTARGSSSMDSGSAGGSQHGGPSGSHGPAAPEGGPRVASAPDSAPAGGSHAGGGPASTGSGSAANFGSGGGSPHGGGGFGSGSGPAPGGGGFGAGGGPAPTSGGFGASGSHGPDVANRPPSTPANTSAASVDAPARPPEAGFVAPPPNAPSARPDQPASGGGAVGGAGAPGGTGGASAPGSGRPGSGGGWTGTPGSPGAAGRSTPSGRSPEAPRPRGPEGTPASRGPAKPDAPSHPGGARPGGPGRVDGPAGPARPGGPVGTHGPGHPNAPAGPNGLARPDAPMRPNGPSGSAHPDAPSRPNGPVKPDSPNASVRPDASARPNGPAGPHGYARPDAAPGSMRPDGPGRPNGSTRPDSANGPVRPDSPNGPARPGAPNAPAHPDGPVRNGRFNGSEMPRQRQPEAPSRVNDPANPRQHTTPQGVHPGTPHAPRFAAPNGLDAPHAPRLDAPHVDAPRVNHPQAAVRYPDTDRYKWADVKHEDFAHVKGEGFRHWGPGWQQRVAEDARIRAESLGYHQPDRPHAPEPDPEAPPRSTSESMAAERPPENPFEHRWNNGILEHKGVDVSPELREKLGGKYTGIRNTDSGLSLIRHSRQGYYGSADFAQRMPRPSVDPKRFTVEVHGSPNGVSFNGKELSAKELAEIIKGAPGYKEGAPVRLLSCQTGADLPDGSPNFAQQLSKELGVEVLAPNKDAWVDNFGNMYASGSRAEFHPDASGTPQPRFDEPGEWVSFSPDGTKAVHESPFPPGHEPEWTRFGHQADAAHQRGGLGDAIGKMFGRKREDSFEFDPVSGENLEARRFAQAFQQPQQAPHPGPYQQQAGFGHPQAQQHAGQYPNQPQEQHQGWQNQQQAPQHQYPQQQSGQQPAQQLQPQGGQQHFQGSQQQNHLPQGWQRPQAPSPAAPQQNWSQPPGQQALGQQALGQQAPGHQPQPPQNQWHGQQPGHPHQQPAPPVHQQPAQGQWGGPHQATPQPPGQVRPQAPARQPHAGNPPHGAQQPHGMPQQYGNRAAASTPPAQHTSDHQPSAPQPPAARQPPQAPASRPQGSSLEVNGPRPGGPSFPRSNNVPPVDVRGPRELPGGQRVETPAWEVSGPPQQRGGQQPSVGTGQRNAPGSENSSPTASSHQPVRSHEDFMRDNGFDQDSLRPDAGDRNPLDEFDFFGDKDFRATAEDHAALRELGKLNEFEVKRIRDENPHLTHITDEELSAMYAYTGMDHQDWNQALRDGDVEEVRKYEVLLRNAVSGLNKLPDWSSTPEIPRVVRGIQIDEPDMEKFLARYEADNTVTENAFTSSTKGDAFYGNVEFVVEARWGKDIEFLRPTGGMREVVWPPGNRFKVDRREFDEETGKWKIFMTDLGR
ncbi:hypothetical protein [Saccharopolyspora hattusasensis]|uniref:WXG100-like domain-containing protein n=1 Tax=Saccharopolyspora hattusasensis TaxID=1128679 RepID=UPI003D9669A3